MSFPRYEKYKDSGVEWLGEVPEEWEVAPLKRGFEVRLGKMLRPEPVSPEDQLLPYLRAANIQWGRVDVSDIKRMWFSPSERDGLLLQVGDLLVSEGGDVGRASMWVGELDECYFQNSVNRVRPLDGNSARFLYYWISAIKDKGYIDVLCNKSTIAHFTAEKVQAVPVPSPSLPEQSTIAAFLDHETGKIDALVAEQEKLIGLLKEKRQAVISHAVTKGLDPNARMKDSGVEWLGEVPEGWVKTRLRNLFRQEKRQNHADKPVLSVYRDYGVILKDSRDDNLNKTPENLSAYQLVNPNDLVVNKMKAWQGSLGVSELEGITSPDYVVFTPRHREYSSYFHLLLRSQRMATVYRSISNGIRPAQWRLEPELFLDLPVYLPTVQEQQEIVSYVSDKANRFDSLTAEAERAIKLLQERRTALISAAVTGKIDVRGWRQLN